MKNFIVTMSPTHICAGLVKKGAILFIAIVFSSLSVKAQDVRFSQPFSVPLKFNPALMGANTDLRAIINYRNQWANIDDGYKTYSFTFLYPVFVEGGKLDIGLGAVNDKCGAFNNMDIALAVGYKLQIAESHYLSASISGGYVQKGLDAASLTFDDQYVIGSFDEGNPSNETILNEKISSPDFSAGILWYYNPSGKMNAYFGISAFHLYQSNKSFTNEEVEQAIRYSYQIGVKMISDVGIDVSPNIVISSQGGAEEIASGLYINYNLDEMMKVTVGGWIRKNNAVAFIVGFEYNNYTIGYSYDLGMSDMNKAISGIMTHEISLAFKLDQSKDAKVNPSPFSSF